jgi:hypothetical protein
LNNELDNQRFGDLFDFLDPELNSWLSVQMQSDEEDADSKCSSSEEDALRADEVLHLNEVASPLRESETLLSQ